MADRTAGAPANGAGEVWVFVEQHDGVAAEVSLELLGRARELAAPLGAGVGAVLAGSGEANDPRPASVKLVMTYKRIVAEAMPEYDDSYLNPASDDAEVCMIGRDGKPVCRARVVQWDHEALAADREALGLRGSPTRVKEIESVVLAQSEARMVTPDEAGIAELVHELIEEHILG